MSAGMAGFESYLSEICGPSKPVPRNFITSFSKSKVDLLQLWVLLFFTVILKLGKHYNTLRHLQMNFRMLFTGGLL